MAVQEIRVFSRDPEDDIKGKSAAAEANRVLGRDDVTVQTEQVFYLEGVGVRAARRLARNLLANPVTHSFTVNQRPDSETPNIREIGFKPGVMNPEVESIQKAADQLGIKLRAAATATAYRFPETLDTDQIDSATVPLRNGLVDQIITERPETLILKTQPEEGRKHQYRLAGRTLGEMDDVFVDKPYLAPHKREAIWSYANEKWRDLTLCEIEIIDAWWSEHCGHETFKSLIKVGDEIKDPFIRRIMTTAERHFNGRVVTAFKDNSGGIKFRDGQAIVGKVETHNSPSAIEPYGGAMTGSGGVFRDILGTGQGAEVIASTDMFVFAPPDMDSDEIPEGCLPPDYLLKKVVAGVRDYGNPVGIPTNNGSITFDKDSRAKPTVIVGGYGIIPEERAQKGEPLVGDFVVAIGGKTGKDGVGGATYSSRELRSDSISVDSTAVQIGNPIEEKRVIDAVIAARDQDLIRALTDCGAAGFSSAIGELGKDTGVEVDIAKAPLKYDGMEPWEIWMSESQERMVIAVAPEKLEAFLKTCGTFNVEATVLGNFTDSKKLVVKYGEDTIADLDYDFLEHGLPQRTLEAKWQSPEIKIKHPEQEAQLGEAVVTVLSDWNVASKEAVVRQYDHTVQGMSALTPYSGVENDGPNDASVMTPLIDKNYGLVISHGINPKMMAIEPYQGTLWATAEAMANFVAAGGDPHEAALINNYIWPGMNERTLGSLDRSVDAVCDVMDALDLPVVSGKDSLSSTYRDLSTGEVIEIKPVLCMSVFGGIEDAKKTISADIKKPGSTLVLVGELSAGMGGTIYYEKMGGTDDTIPEISMKLLPQVLERTHQAIQTGKVLSVHDISQGGLVATVAEMCFGGDNGAEITVDYKDFRPDQVLFNETAGNFVVEVEDPEKAAELFDGVPHQILGKTTSEKTLIAQAQGQQLFSLNMDDLKAAWKRPMEELFG